MRRNRLAALGLGTVLLLAACSDTDSDTTGTTIGDDASSGTTVVVSSSPSSTATTTSGSERSTTTSSSAAGSATTRPGSSGSGSSSSSSGGSGATTTAAGTVEAALAAVQDRSVASFVTALRASGLAGDLASREVTIFAPDDGAFRALGEDTVRSLLADPAGLKELLLDHVVEGSWPEDELRTTTSLTAMSGRQLTVDSTGGAISVEGAQLVRIDDGDRPVVVHVIDRVLDR